MCVCSEDVTTCMCNDVCDGVCTFDDLCLSSLLSLTTVLTSLLFTCTQLQSASSE